MFLERADDVVEIEDAVFLAALQALAVGLAGMDMPGARDQHIDLFLRMALRHEMRIVEADHQARHVFQHALAFREAAHDRFAVRLWPELDAELTAMIDHAAHLLARDFIGLFLGLAVILVDDAGRDRDTGTPDRMTKSDEGFVHLEIVVPHAFVGNGERAFQFIYKLFQVFVTKPNEAVIDVEAERFHDTAHAVRLGHRVLSEGRPIDMGPAHGGMREAERLDDLRRAFERQMALKMLNAEAPARHAETDCHVADPHYFGICCGRSLSTGQARAK